MCQLLIANAVMIAICYIYMLQRSMFTPANEATRISRQLDRLPTKTWGQLRRQQNLDEPSDCSFCLMEYEEDSQVVQLRCHNAHVFHKECFQTFMRNIREQQVGDPKCPLCQ